MVRWLTTPLAGTVQTSMVPISSAPMQRGSTARIVATWTPSGATRRLRPIPSGTGVTPGYVVSIAHGPHVPPQPSSAQTWAGQFGVHAAAWQAPLAQPNGHVDVNVSNAQVPALQ